jgi:REP-associated tyrosine transposase
MARPLRLEFPGAFYYVTSHGPGTRNIYRDSRDRRAFIEILGQVIERFKWRCHAYCLLGNRYDLLVETPDANLSRGMRHLNAVYTQYFNRRHQAAGALFQGRFRAIVVDPKAYLARLARHIVLEPVRAGLAKDLAEYRWSSFAATAGIGPAPSFLARAALLSRFGPRQTAAAARYAKFVRAEDGSPPPWSSVRAQLFLGSDLFIRKMQRLLAHRRGGHAGPESRRYAERPSLAKAIPLSGIRTRTQRNQAIRKSYLEYGYTMSKIAQHLGLHYSTVSKVISRRAADSRS